MTNENLDLTIWNNLIPSSSSFLSRLKELILQSPFPQNDYNLFSQLDLLIAELTLNALYYTSAEL